MIDQFTNLEDADVALPTSSLDLSARMRDLRARQGLKQSEVARRMGLDPSIPSLWEQGKRLVPANRVRSLAEALDVPIEELLDGVSGTHRVAATAITTPNPVAAAATAVILPAVDGQARTMVAADLGDDRGPRARAIDSGSPLLRLLPPTPDEPVSVPVAGDAPAEPWIVPERPALDGFIPDGWQPADRIQDISPSLPDGYWIDPVKLEKSTARHLLRSRLCITDQAAVAQHDVPGAALAERVYQHCSKQDGFLSVGRMPLAEMIFRCVMAADHGGLTDSALVETLRERSGAVPVSSTLLRRLRDTVRSYPIRRVDAEFFGGRR
jgi:transcriptional regulator with XRE-family HTH domain